MCVFLKHSCILEKCWKIVTERRWEMRFKLWMKSLHHKNTGSACVPSSPGAAPPAGASHFSGAMTLCGLGGGGSGSADSCIKDNSGEEIYPSSAASAASRTLERSACSATTGQNFAVWGVFGSASPGTSWASWSCISAWTGYGAEPAGGPAPAADSSNVSGLQNSHRHSGAHPETSVTHWGKKWGSLISFLYLNH